MNAFRGPSHFGENYSGHEPLDAVTNDALDAVDEYGFGTLFSRSSQAVSKSVLSFDAEEEARFEVVDLADAGNEVRSVFVGDFEVSMGVGYEPVKSCE